MSLLFAIDLDETLVSAFFDGRILEKYNKKFPQNPISYDDMTDFYFQNIDGLDEIFDEYMEENFENMEFFPDAKNILAELKNLGIRMIIITSRPAHQKQGTIRFLKKHFSKNFFEKILFTADYDSDNKAQIAKREWVNIAIDDAGHHIVRYIAETNILTLKMDASWNREIPYSERIIPVKNWQEIKEFFIKFLQK